MDVGAAKCKALDKPILDKFTKRVGTKQVRKAGIHALEATWMATQSGVWYVTPRVESVVLLPWAEIFSLMLAKERKASADVLIELDGTDAPLTLSTGLSAASRLVALYEAVQVIERGTAPPG